jgi:hypothetical protein
MKKTTLFTMALVIASSLAAQTMAASGTPEQQAACRPDVRKYCHQIKEGSDDMAFLACLQEHRARLSPKCTAVLQSNGQLHAPGQ